MMTRLLGLCVGILALPACYVPQPPVTSSRSNNPEISVQTLFTHDGCTVYRFFDAGYHYYARCDAAHATVATMSTVSCGRNCRRQEDIATVGVDRPLANGAGLPPGAVLAHGSGLGSAQVRAR